MDERGDLTVRITKDGRVLVQEESDGGVLSYKEIEPSAFHNCIKNSLRHMKIASGLLPPGCFHFSTDERDTRYVATALEAQTADVSYEKTQYIRFPLPKLVFGFTVSKNGKLERCRIGIAEDTKITMESKMYCYPFSNVSGFSLCTGLNQMPNIKTLSQLAGIPYYILSMPNNDDNYSAGKNRLGLESRALFEHLKDKTSDYYYSDVLKLSGETISNFLDEEH
jgi:hypothetical protein